MTSTMLAAFPISAKAGFLTDFFRITFWKLYPAFCAFRMRGDFVFTACDDRRV